MLFVALICVPVMVAFLPDVGADHILSDALSLQHKEWSWVWEDGRSLWLL
jgi:hypothetical protein